jgi:ferritin-like metal-binding protein YciE
MKELREMLVDQLKDAHSAERQAIQAMKRVMRKTSDPELRKGIEAHIAQSEEQRNRVEQALEQLGGRAGRKVCEAMRGLVEEAQHELEDHDKGPILDLVIVAGQQRIEHYEIAAYGTMVELSKAMGENEVADLLAQTLAEEKQQDEKLTEVTRSTILPAALSSGEEEEEDDEEEDDDGEDEEDDEEEDSAPAKKAGRSAKRGR